MTFKYEKDSAVILLSLYVDDWLAATNNDQVYQEFIRALSDAFELSACGDLDWYLGVAISQDLELGTTTNCQEQYIKQLLARFSMSECNPAPTPMMPNSRLLRADSPAKGKEEKKLIKEYQKLVGALLYLTAWTRPDCAFAVNQAAKFMSNPGPTHLAAAKRILRYLKGTAHMGITYSRSNNRGNILWAFADADHAGDPDTR